MARFCSKSVLNHCFGARFGKITGCALLSAALCGCGGNAPTAGVAKTAADVSNRESRPQPIAERSSPIPQGDAAPPVGTAPTSAVAGLNEQLLWDSPTSGKPIDLHYLPPGIQGVIAWRPAASLGSPAGEATVAALERVTRAGLDELAARLGTPLKDVERLTIGLLDGELTDAGLSAPRLALVAYVNKAIDVAELAPKWNAKLQSADDTSFYANAETAWYLPADEAARCLVAVPRALMPEVLELEGAAPSLRGDLEPLWSSSDGDRWLTVLLSPAFLAGGGKQMLTGEWEPVREALDFIGGDQVVGVLFSAHLEGNLFLEVRFQPKPDVGAVQLERAVRKRLTESPQHLEAFLSRGTPTPYSREVLARLPQMWKLAVDLTRLGHQDRQVVVRTYLPNVAAHNLAWSATLALTEIVPAAAEQGAGSANLATLSINQRLQRRIALRFPRQTLEQGVELFAREAGISVEILGGDLQLEGITKNQSFSLETADLPAREVLEKILQLASPDGKLVYVLRGDGESTAATIAITTPAAAVKRGARQPDASGK